MDRMYTMSFRIRHLKFFILWMMISPVLLFGQNINKAEYFYDTDPGFGAGFDIPVIPACNITNLQYSIGLGSVTPGFHNLYVRARDENGKWSFAQYCTFYKASVVIPPLSANITGAEYFYDTDPGFGSGTVIPMTPAVNISNFQYSINLASVQPGFHNLYVRAKDSNGKWSFSTFNTFYKAATVVPPSLPNVTKMEYFFDTDPGFGAGTAIPVTSSTNISNFQYIISLSGVTPGFHILYIRAGDETDKWSLCNYKPFFKGETISPVPLPDVTKVEYFFDTDPGYGMGTDIPVTPSVNINNLSVFIDLSALSSGPHTIWIRAKDAYGKWSEIVWNTFTVTYPSASVSIAASSNPVCAGHTVTFTATPSNGGNTPAYQWKVNGNNAGSNSATFSYVPVNNDVINCIMTSSLIHVNGSPATSNSITLTVNPSPTPTVNGPATACAGDSGLIYYTEPGKSGYAWIVSSGGTITAGSGTSQVTVKWNTPGNRTVSVNYSGTNGCTAANPANKSVVVSPLPVPSITGATTAYAGSVNHVYTTNPGQNNYNWQISPGGTIVSGLGTNIITVNWNSLGNQSLTVNFTSVSPCQPAAPGSITVSVIPAPPLTVQATATPQTVCSGSPVQLHATVSGGLGIYNYSWSSDPTGFSSLHPDTTVTPLASTVYTLQVTDGQQTATSSVAVSVQSLLPPDPVANMLPADSNFSVQAPVTFSWSAANRATGYDLYIWRTNQPRPEIPTVSNLVQTSYVYPEYLNVNYLYYWQVVAKNNCCTVTTAGPIQIFSFNVFSDLWAGGITMPDTITAGNSAGFTFSVHNTGTGGTGFTPWKDEIYLSTAPEFNSSTSIPAGNFNNLNPLSPGTMYTKNAAVTISAQLEGSYYVFVKTDALNNIQETNETNNLVRAQGTVYIKQPPYPDLWVRDVQPLTNSVVPDSLFQLSWIVENAGDLAAIGGWSQRISLISGTKRYVLGYTQFTDPLPSAGVITQTALFTIPRTLGMEGNVYSEVLLTPYPALIEKPNGQANNIAVSALATPAVKRIFINFPQTSIYENSLSPMTCSVTRSGDISGELAVNLSLSEAGRITIPGLITIPPNQANAGFSLYAINNSLTEGSKIVTVSASTAGYPVRSDQITVLDDEIPSLTIQVNKTQVNEGDTVSVTVSRDLVSNSPLLTGISLSNPSQGSIPNSITIPAGQASFTFNMIIVNDNIPELPQDVIISAFATGFSTGVKTINVLDNDIPQIQFSITPDSVSEANGIYAAIGTIQRVAPGTGTNTIHLTTSMAGQLIIPGDINLPANVMQKQFNIGVVDNTMVDGNRTIKVTASVYLPGCGCGAPPSSGGTITDSLTVMDNDGPSISVIPNPGTVPEGLATAGTLTISRNTSGGPEITVYLTSNSPDEISVPPTAIIPAGSNSVSVPFASVDDSIQDGDQMATITASAAGYTSGFNWVIVTDRNLPDLVIEQLQIPVTSATVHSKVPVNIQVKNNGFATAAYGAEVRYYLSSNTVLDDNDFHLTSRYTTSAIPVNGTLTMQDTIDVPVRLGDQFLIAIVNKNQEINELIYYNNQSEPKPFSIIPDYNAVVSVNGDVFNGKTPILISGSATMSDNQPAANKPIDVYIIMNGVRRVYPVTTGSDGGIQLLFQPLNGEAGNFSVGACFPGQGLTTAQDEFIVLGMKYTGDQLSWNMFLGENRSGSLQIKNFSSIDLSGVTIEVVSAPPGCTVTFDPVGNLPGNAVSSTNFQVNATGLSPSFNYQEVKLRITCTEGATYDFSAWYYCTNPTGYIRTVPVALSSKMIKGQSTIREFQIQNIGNGNTGRIHIVLPQAEWMSLVSTDTITSLPPQGTAVASLRLTPTDELPLNTPITGGLGVSCVNANSVTVPFNFEAISQSTGDLLVDVTDEFSFYTASGAHVDSARVIIRHPYNGTVIAEGLTGQNGTVLFTGIPEGNYNLTVDADRHANYQNNIYVEKAIVNTKSVFISFQPISYSWNVVPTQIQDNYQISLVVEFATNVPVPVVLFSMPDTMPHLTGNEQFPFIVTLTNKGLITAQDVSLLFPEDPEYQFVCLVDKVNILPQQTLQIPVVMKRQENAKAYSGDCFKIVFIKYSYTCGPDRKWQSAMHTMTFNTRICASGGGWAESYIPFPFDCPDCPPDAPIPPGGWPEFYDPPIPPLKVPVLQFSEDCDPCLEQIAEYLLDKICDKFSANWFCRGYKIFKCYGDIIEKCGDQGDKKSLACAKAVAGCFIEIKSPFGDTKKVLELCKPGTTNKSVTGLSFLPPIQEKMEVSYAELTAMKIWMIEFFGDSAWLDCNDAEYQYFHNYFDSLNPMNGVQVTPELLAHRPSNISEAQVTNFVARWNNSLNYDNGLPYDSLNVINYDITAAQFYAVDSAEHRAIQYGYPSTLDLVTNQLDSLQYWYNQKSGSVCAKVTLKFDQSMTMTREAFDGTLTVTNGHETKDIQNVLLDLQIKDDEGTIRNDLFQINTLSLNELTGINGTGTLGPTKTGTAVVRFIPEKGAAPVIAKYYSFGGNLSYKDPFTDEIVTRPLYPVRLQVNPSPDLYLDYFMQRDILGDNALTEPIEPSIPAELAVMVNNKGTGTAQSVNLQSSQPVIIDNEKGLLIDFGIIGSNLGGHPKQLGLYDVNFGNIPAGKVSVGQWWFTSSLLGHFVSYSATINHLDSYGNRDLSLVSSVKIHELTHSIMAYGALYDTVGDFLVNEIPDGNDRPDHLYFSNGTDTTVALADTAWTDRPVTIADTIVHLTVKPGKPGWNYTMTHDPGNGLYRIAAITRNDGQVIPLNNMWLTYCTIPDGGDPIYENKLHFADLFITTDTTGYNVVFTPIDQNPPRVVSILGIPTSAANEAVDSVDVVFSEPITDTTFTYEDMTLRCQGGANLMDSLVTVAKVNDTVYRVFFNGKTALNGYYTLIVQAAGISDLSGNSGRDGKMVSWIQAMSVPAISLFIGVPQTPGEPIDSMMVLFNMPIFDSTFTLDKLQLIKNQHDTIPVGTLSISPADADHLLFRISGLLPLTNGDGNFKLTVKVSAIWGRNGQHGLADQFTAWTVCITSPPTALAGIEDTTCSNHPYVMSGVVTNTSSFSWSTSGSGSFFNPASLNAVYHPSPMDIAYGSVIITLTAQASNNCSQPAVSSFTLHFIKAPYAYAGNGATLLYGQNFTVTNAQALNGLPWVWTSSGSGQFSDPLALNPVYYPSTADSGSITLTLTVPGHYPCDPAISPIIVNYAKPVHPVIQASNLVFSNKDTASLTVNWTDGSGSKRIVFMKQDTTGFPEPEMATLYTGNTYFGAGSQIGYSGWYCVFNGDIHPGGITVSHLQPGLKYRLMALEYNSTFGLSFYQTQTAVLNPVNYQTCFVNQPVVTGDTSVCPGTAILFSTENGMTDYNWTIIPEGSVISGQSTNQATVICNSSGIKTIKVNYRYPSGCPSSRGIHSFRVKMLPSGNNSIVGPYSVCFGATGINYFDSSFVHALSYQWSVPEDWTIAQGQGTASVMVNFPSASSSGIITVSGINECGTGSSSSHSVTVNPPLTGVIYLWNKTIHAGDVICYSGRKIAAAGAGTVYIVQSGGSATMIAADTVRLRPGTKIDHGGYFHALATKYCIPCMTNKSAILTDAETNSGEENLYPGMPGKSCFRVYPNPTNGEFIVEWLDNKEVPQVVTIRIKDLLGKELMTTEFRGGYTKRLSLSDFKSGIYLISVTDGISYGMEKIVKW